jgi:hypothetical protein
MPTAENLRCRSSPDVSDTTCRPVFPAHLPTLYASSIVLSPLPDGSTTGCLHAAAAVRVPHDGRSVAASKATYVGRWAIVAARERGARGAEAHSQSWTESSTSLSYATGNRIGIRAPMDNVEPLPPMKVSWLESFRY